MNTPTNLFEPQTFREPELIMECRRCGETKEAGHYSLKCMVYRICKECEDILDRKLKAK